MTTCQPIGLKVHATLDVAFAVAALAAPWVLGYADLRAATLYTVAVALLGFGLNLITDYPAGVLKILPFKWHRVVEWFSPPPFIIVPWVFFADARAMPWLLSAIGIAIVLNASLTRPVQTRPA
ncbi:MAG TPA: hypothetical protein VGA88_06720 [Burkholderiales bacterium]|jgi:hypothetical protein